MKQSSHLLQQFVINFLPAQKVLWKVKHLNPAEKINLHKTSLRYLELTSSVKWEDPHPLLFIPPPHTKAGDALKLGKVLSHSDSS